ncbi:hypothetical protein ACH5RR_032267 [Cinchona calisaya]|uniref:Uncharacterized protein n=1 Tax=Cinchona calisaya TaxID=153742 RepID=A0ABD2YHL6_9GENT
MSNSIFSSTTSEQRWVNQFNDHFVIFIDNQPSIFRVPKRVSDTKPEAYAPQQIGLGAYHHFRPELDDEMESKKLEVLKKFLKPQEYNNFKNIIVDKVKELEQQIRSCYNNYLDLDRDTLAWIMAIDGTYLLYLISTMNPKNRHLSEDILKLENQIPVIVLKKIIKALHVPPDDGNNLDTDLFSNYFNFCDAHSPLELCKETDQVVGGDQATISAHLLSYLYNLTMKNWISHDFILSPKKNTDEQSGSAIQFMSSVRNENQPLILPPSSTTITGLAEPLISPDEETDTLFQEAETLVANLTGLRPLMLLARLPLREGIELFNVFKNVDQSKVEEIKIPSVSQLHEITKLDFKKWTEKGIGIKYKESEHALYLPVMKLNTSSEVVLRNLKAYEEASDSPGSDIRFSDYLDFMCGIIDTAKDVELLKEKGIIDSKMENEEITELFNGIHKSNLSNWKTDGLEQTIQRLNKRYDDTFRIKFWRYVKQHFTPSEAFIRIFLYVLVVVLLTFQAFCDVYGCSKRWS